MTSPSIIADHPRGLYGQIVEMLGSDIVVGLYQPWQVLAPEKLVINLRISRTVLREALRVLESKGLILARPNVGTRVQPIERWDLLDADVLRWRRGAPLTERLDADIEVFTGHLRALSDVLDGNVLYRQLMQSVTGQRFPTPADLAAAQQDPVSGVFVSFAAEADQTLAGNAV